MVLLVNQVKDAIAILKLDKTKMASVAERSDTVKWGIIILAVPPLLNIILFSQLFPSGFGTIFTSVVFWAMLIPTLSVVGSIFAMSLIAERFFKAGSFHWQFFKVLSYASVTFWLTPLAFLLDLIGLIDASGIFNLIWSIGMIGVFVVAYNFLVHHKHLSQKDAALTLIGGVVAYYLLQQILGNILVGRYYRMML